MKRVLTAIVMIVAVGALIFFDHTEKLWYVTGVAALLALLGSLEFRTIAAAVKAPVPLWWTIAAVLLFFYGTAFLPFDLITIVSLLAIILFTWAAMRTPLDRVLPETAAGLLMLVYIAYPLTLMPRFLKEENGTALLLFLFLCVWSGDIAALYFGKHFGKRQLAPNLSPQKTWVGAIASLIASAAFGMALVGAGEYLTRTGSSFTRLHTSEPWWQSLLLALLLNVAAQLGDLLESALKRGAGIKDSGTLLPGHGGILDRIDALLLAAPVLWLYIAIKACFSLSSIF
jgi:phosphatidate cytidylyltransferase